MGNLITDRLNQATKTTCTIEFILPNYMLKFSSQSWKIENAKWCDAIQMP